MNVSRFIMIAIPLGVVLIYFVMQSLTVDESANRDLVARGDLMEEIKRRSFPDVYASIETGFPEAYRQHVEEIEEIALDRELTRFELGPELIEEADEFVDDLLQANRQYLRSAGRAPLLEVQRAQVALLRALESTPELCVQVAKDGLDQLDRFKQSRIDPKLRGRWIATRFDAIVAGRDTPEAFEPPSEYDWRVFLQGWRDAEGEMTPPMEAYLSADTSDPAVFCEGAIGFARRLIADTTPSGLRILVDYSSKSAD